MSCLELTLPPLYAALYPSGISPFVPHKPSPPLQSQEVDPRFASIRMRIHNQVSSLACETHDFSGLAERSILEWFSKEKVQERLKIEDEIRITRRAIDANRSNEVRIAKNPSETESQRRVQIIVLSATINRVSLARLRDSLLIIRASQHVLLDNFEEACKDISLIESKNELVLHLQELMDDLQHYSLSESKAELFLEKTEVSQAKEIHYEVSPHGLTQEDITRLWKYNRRLCERVLKRIESLICKDRKKNVDLIVLAANKRAAKEGNVIAQHNLGYCYFHGFGVEKNKFEAVRWYRLAADKGHSSAQTSLGYCYNHGHGVEKNVFEAVRLYRLAADKGNLSAQYGLGYCYENGRGVEKNEFEAVRWYRLAADKGLSKAQTYIGHCYFHGIGVEKNEFEVVRWYRLAADKGHLNAQTSLGYCYFHGIGVEKNEFEAVQWYQLAADKGNSNAQHSLAFCYENGFGVQKDIQEAKKWYQKAAADGMKIAADALTRLEADTEIDKRKIVASSETFPREVL